MTLLVWSSCACPPCTEMGRRSSCRP
ncbi:unnamed protein product [Ophioblennius macclurei]